jgi:hypothetical protein
LASREIQLPPAHVQEQTARQWEDGANGIGAGGASFREWPALLRMLERSDTSYKN